MRQLCGNLEQAHKVVQKRWHGTQLSKQMDSSLRQEAKDGLRTFNKYFNDSQNLVTTVRKNFAHHFDSEILRGSLCSCPPSELHEFIAAMTYGNIFYKFAEDLRYHAIVRAIGGKNLQEAVAKLYDEPRQSALRPFEAFADDVLSFVRCRSSIKALHFIQMKRSRTAPAEDDRLSAGFIDHAIALQAA